VLPIPVLLNLATWRSEFASFDEWLRRILPNELGASKALAEKIRDQIPLILLLDGFDEVLEQDRNSCLEALGQYGIKPEHQFALTTRIEEYAAAKDAAVYGQVEIAPLTAQQIEMSLTAYAGLTPEAKPLLNAIQKDPLLKQSLENPFYLNTAQLLFASGKNWSEFNFSATDVEGRQQELVQRFVEYALKYKVKQDYLPEKAEKWLRFLAGKMEEDKLRVFELVDFKPIWTNLYLTYTVLIFSPLIVFFVKFNNKLIQSTHPDGNPDGIDFLVKQLGGGYNGKLFLVTFILFLTIILMAIITGGFNQNHKRHHVDAISWAWNKAVKDWRIILKEGFESEHKIPFIASILLLIIFPLVSLIRENTDVFIIKILLSIKIIIIFWLGLFLYAGFSTRNLISLNHPYQRFVSAFKFFNLSGLQHLILRILVAIESSLPLRLVHFLNEMSRRHLLEFDGDLDTESGGGSWRWRHRIIQEYFLKAEKD